jgi:ABC-type glycerol-3-phosphate transport system substrate-binding protein
MPGPALRLADGMPSNTGGSMKRVTLVATLVAAAVSLLALAAVSSAKPTAPAAGGNLTIWLSGTYAGSTPGSTYRKWLDGIKARYAKKFPGSKVSFVLTPINNAQFTAQIAAAFASRRVPDAMLVYSGGYTTPYMLSSLRKLNDDVNKTPGFYASQSLWDLSCLDLNCKNGKGDIYGVPNDGGTYALFYNKALFKKAGVAKPPRTYKEVLAACTKFKAAGIIPLAYGDRDGYSTDNWVTYNYVSFVKSRADITNVWKHKIKYTDPRLVKALEDLVQFKKQGCVNADASTHENNDANTYFTSGKAAMVQMFPFVAGDFHRALGANLGISRLPVSGNGPFKNKVAGNSFHNWVIPKNAKNSEGAWEFIKLAVDKPSHSQLAKLTGAPPTNRAALAAAKDPYAVFFRKALAEAVIPVLDSVIPLKEALLYYVQLQAAFSGKATPLQAMKNVEKGLKTLNP